MSGAEKAIESESESMNGPTTVTQSNQAVEEMLKGLPKKTAEIRRRHAVVKDACEVEQKIEKVPCLAGRTVQKVLITKSNPTRELVRSSYFSRIIPAQGLLRTFLSRGQPTCTA